MNDSVCVTISDYTMASDKVKNIIFYFPYRGVGGVSVLFLRLGKLLAGHMNVYYVDFLDGYMAKRLPPKAKLIPFGSEALYPQNSVFIFQTVAPWNLVDNDRFPVDSKVIFWNLFPYNLNPNLFLGITGSWIKRLVARVANVLSFPRRRKLSLLLDYLEKRKSIVFMDGENLSTTEKLFRTQLSRPIFLPVVTDVPTNQRWRSHRGDRETLRAAWIGRVEDFKVPILRHLILRLEAVSVKIPITMIIIGEGIALEEIKGLSKPCQNLTFEFRGEVSTDNLTTVLTEDIDILFAMGTSALEGAKHGVPTVLLDYSYKEISGLYRFRYIFSAREYNLAEEISYCHFEKRCTLGEVLALVRHQPDMVSEMCFNHWDMYHNPNRGYQNFLNTADQAEATVGELRKLGFFSADIASRTIKAARNRYLPKSENAGIGAG